MQTPRLCWLALTCFCCVALQACVTTTSCVNGAQRDENGSCVAPVVVPDGGLDCGGCDADSGTPACNTQTGQCVECTSAQHCDGGQICEGATHMCTDPPPCTSGGSCPDELVCNNDALNPRCVECTGNEHCDGEVCSPGNVCVGCLVDGDCGVDQVCDQGTNECVGCVDDDDCDGGCDLATNTCVACTSDNHCPDGSCDTDSNTCLPCANDGECTNPDTPHCLEGGGGCVECETDAHCTVDGFDAPKCLPDHSCGDCQPALLWNDGGTPIIEYNDVDHTRDSPASLWMQDTQCYQTFRTNRLRKFADGSVYLEGERTNYAFDQNLDFAQDNANPLNGWATNSKWGGDPDPVGGGLRIAADISTAHPFAGTIWKVAFPPGTDVLEIVLPTSSTQLTLSAFDRTPASREASAAGGNWSAFSATGTGDWGRRTKSGVGNKFRIRQPVVGMEPSVFFGMQAEDGFFVSQFIDPADTNDGNLADGVTRQADTLTRTLDSDQIQALLGGSWSIQFMPAFTPLDLRSAEVAGDTEASRAVVLDVGNGFRLELRSLNAVAAQLCLDWGQPTTLCRNVGWDAATGTAVIASVTVDEQGCTLNGSTPTSCWSVPAAATVRVGAKADGSVPFHGRVGNPKASP